MTQSLLHVVDGLEELRSWTEVRIAVAFVP